MEHELVNGRTLSVDQALFFAAHGCSDSVPYPFGILPAECPRADWRAPKRKLGIGADMRGDSIPFQLGRYVLLTANNSLVFAVHLPESFASPYVLVIVSALSTQNAIFALAGLNCLEVVLPPVSSRSQCKEVSLAGSRAHVCALFLP